MYSACSVGLQPRRLEFRVWTTLTWALGGFRGLGLLGLSVLDSWCRCLRDQCPTSRDLGIECKELQAGSALFGGYYAPSIEQIHIHLIHEKKVTLLALPTNTTPLNGRTGKLLCAVIRCSKVEPLNGGLTL